MGPRLAVFALKWVGGRLASQQPVLLYLSRHEYPAVWLRPHLRTCGRDSAEEAQEDKFVLPYLDKVLNYKIAITSTQCCNLNITVLNQFLSPWDPESRPTTLGTCTFPSLLTVGGRGYGQNRGLWVQPGSFRIFFFFVCMCVFLPCFLISL